MRRTRITVETESLTILRSARMQLGWCPECGAEGQVITVVEDGPRDPETAEQIARWYATNKLHRWTTASGMAQLCLQSLMRCIDLEEGTGTGFKEER